MRTKACIHTLTGHTNTVADVVCQAANPQVSNCGPAKLLNEIYLGYSLNYPWDPTEGNLLMTHH